MQIGLTPEEEQKYENREFKLAIISGSILYSLVGIALVYFCKAILLKILGIGLVIYSIFQFIYLLTHKEMTESAKKFFIIMNIVPYFLFTISTW